MVKISLLSPNLQIQCNSIKIPMTFFLTENSKIICNLKGPWIAQTIMKKNPKKPRALFSISNDTTRLLQ